MIKLTLTISADDWFERWARRADTATKACIERFNNGEPLEFRKSLWQDLKPFLSSISSNKCAYCESFIPHIAYGEVEHYRPKRKVAEDSTHPGYFWLAYTAANLLLCCSKCNNARAKATHFPIVGVRWRRPEEQDEESPLLLNPMIDDPGEHLEFVIGPGVTPVGTVVGKTERGITSREIYQLDRPDLVTVRRQRQVAHLNAMRLRWSLSAVDAQTFEMVNDGTAEYTAALRAIARAEAERIKAEATALSAFET